VKPVYDAENRIQSTAGTTYTYDSDGNRVKKVNTTTGIGTLYWYGLPGIIAESDLSGILKSEYVFVNGKRAARIDVANNSVHYYLSDHLNSTSMVISSAGVTEDESDYSAFGTEYPVTSSGANHYKFSGKERDSESQLDYFGARYYSNAFGRFLTPDWAATPESVPWAEFDDPQTLNLYGYVRGLPTTRFDAEGHQENSDEQRKIFKRVVAAVTGPINIVSGSIKVAATAPTIEIPPLAAYLGINGTGQAISGASQVVYAVTGNENAETASKLVSSVTTVSGAITLLATKDADKASIAASIENLGVGGAVVQALEHPDEALEILNAAAESLGATFELFNAGEDLRSKPSPPKADPQPPQAPNKKEQKKNLSQNGPGSNRDYSVGPNPGEPTGLTCVGSLCPN
jgi:RHS repeat-associated protein